MHEHTPVTFRHHTLHALPVTRIICVRCRAPQVDGEWGKPPRRFWWWPW